MAAYLEALKPGAEHGVARAAYLAGYYPVLRFGKRVIWRGEDCYKKKNFGADAKQMATDEAATVLACDAGSLMAEQLQRAVDTGEPIDG